MELHRLTLTEMLAAVKSRACQPLDIVQSCLDRIASIEPLVDAWAHLPDREAWLDNWHRSRGRRLLSFNGLPLGVKDTIDVAGLPAERGSPIWAGRTATEDAACVSRLKAAGLCVAGKTVTTEFAYFTPGKTANPYDTAHTPGGSSSGSAAAVAAAMVPVTLGTQTAASVVRPASFCGIAAYVSSVGRFSLRGVTPLAWSFDAMGTFARSIQDLQLVEAALSGEHFHDLPCAAPSSLLAVDGTAFGTVDPAMLEAYESALAGLAARGIRIVRPAFAHAGSDWPNLHHRLMAFEAAQSLSAESLESPDRLSETLRALVDEGQAITLEARARLLGARNDALHQLDAVRSECEFIITPAAPGGAPRGLHATGSPHLSRPWQLFGLPQAVLPMSMDASGLPLGIQLVGRSGKDRALLCCARWLEQAMGWTHVPPPMLCGSSSRNQGKPAEGAVANATSGVASGKAPRRHGDDHRSHT